MSNQFVLRVCLLGLLGLLAGCEDEGHSDKGFAIAEFNIVKNGVDVLSDKFDGAAPQLRDALQSKAAAYQVIGRLAAPKGNRQSLVYDQAQVAPINLLTRFDGSVPVINPEAMLNGAILETDIDPSDRTAGFKPGMTFEVTGTFDMTPRAKDHTFFIGLSDGVPAIGDNPAIAARDSIVLGHTLYRTARNGVSMVFFRSIDYTTSSAGTSTNLTYEVMAPDGAQIKLRLRKADPAVNRITASYALVNNGIVGPYVDLGQTLIGAGYMPIFRDHAYTRPLFGASWPKRTEVAEFTFTNVVNTLTGKQPPRVFQKDPVIPPLSRVNPHAREELIEFPTRDFKAKALLTYEVGTRPAFVAVMLPGGRGDFRFNESPEGISMVNAARLQNRIRPLLLQRGIASVMLDGPGDNPEMRLSFRESDAHLSDLKTALAVVEKRFPGVPVVIVSHSAGAWSAAFLTAAAPGKVAATIMIAPVLAKSDLLNEFAQERKILTGLGRYDWSTVKRPLLLIHHKKDDCWGTPYSASYALSQRVKRIKLLTVDSERDASTGNCGTTGPHNFEGHDKLVVDSIVGWVKQQNIKETRSMPVTIVAR